MVLNRYNIGIGIQVLLQAGVAMLVTLSIGRADLKLTTAGLLLVWGGQILYLMHYLHRAHRDMERFMDALKNRDTSQSFQGKKAGPYFRKLYGSFNEITRNFRLVRIDREAENQFVREAIEQSGSGILAVAGDGTIPLVNSALLDMLSLERLTHLSQLEQSQPQLAPLFSDDTGAGEFKVLAGNTLRHLAVSSSLVRLRGEPVRIYSLTDISREMDRREVEAWQKLIRVMKHEIINSITPLHILATSMLEMYEKGGAASDRAPDEATKERTLKGLDAMEKRSRGLREFLQRYEDLSRIPSPQFRKTDAGKLIRQVASLMEAETDRHGIRVQIHLPPDGLELLADEKLVEQTLINLVRNSITALEGRDKPEIHLTAGTSGEGVFMEVSDNGSGISTELLDQIFVPFFTTSPEGSGIGLSLARQVMQAHRGSIRATSEEGRMTTFTLQF
jgi:signal transduction histidine kinase